MTGPVDDQTLHAIAQHKHGGHHEGQGHIRVDAPTLFEGIHAIQRHHERGAVGKVDDVQHTIDQGQPQRNQGIDSAGG